jgi:O-antigen ligase
MAAYQRYVDKTWLMLGRTQAEQFFGRSGGMFGIPNSLAGLLELMIPVCLTLFFSRATKALGKIICGWMAVLFVFAVVLTGSRGGWISLGLALMLWPLLGGRGWRKPLAGAAIVLAITVAGLWSLFRFSTYARERIQPFLEGRFEPSRPIIWKAGWQIWRDHPWLGSGAASYNVLFDQYRPRGFLNEPNWAHNDYLNTLSDYGVAGFGLWILAGGGLLWLGWNAVQRARIGGASAVGFFGLEKWKLGLFVGLLAFAFHLGVDFHTKLPALAFAAAIVSALLLRDESWLWQPLGFRLRRGLGFGLAAMSLAIGAGLAAPLYQAEALRQPARRAIDKNARTGQGDLRQIIPAAGASFEQAVKIHPANGQAWADLSYATVEGWDVTKGDLPALGRLAERQAERALVLCPVNAEYWVRKGVALDMQTRQAEGEQYFRRALTLAPNSSTWWYHFAYHLSVYPARKAEALRAVETCLTLDPSNSVAVALQQQITAPR